jgi:hypothetical protein
MKRILKWAVGGCLAVAGIRSRSGCRKWLLLGSSAEPRWGRSLL